MSALGPVNDIAIHRLRIKSTLSDAKELARDFETGGWVAENEQEWLFVRSLAVKGKKHELRLQTSQALDSARRTAVFGGSSAATQANAVRFASLSELVAYLLRDLVNGDAVFRWYWQRWAYLLRESKANAIGQLLWEQTATLPAIVEQLAQVRGPGLVVRIDQQAEHRARRDGVGHHLPPAVHLGQFGQPCVALDQLDPVARRLQVARRPGGVVVQHPHPGAVLQQRFDHRTVRDFDRHRDLLWRYATLVDEPVGHRCQPRRVRREGALTCTTDCFVNASECHQCGNGAIEGIAEGLAEGADVGGMVSAALKSITVRGTTIATISKIRPRRTVGTSLVTTSMHPIGPPL